MAKELEISIDPKRKLWYVIFRREVMQYESYQEEMNVIKRYYALIEKYFVDVMCGTFFEYSKNYVVALFQPGKLRQEESVARVLAGSGELFLKALNKNLGLENSVLIGEEPVFLEELLREFVGICDWMVWLGANELTVKKLVSEPRARIGLTESRKQELFLKVLKLEFYLEGLEEVSILATIEELKEELQGISSMHDLFALEVYCGISARLISWIGRLGIGEELAFCIGTMNLYNVSLHASWREAFGYLRRVAENMFALKSQSQERQNEDVVNQVKRYIAEHISGDTSLYTLAEQVHFSQEYLLRIFKKREGVTILQYINELKLGMAKELLTGSEIPVKEIAEQLGFASQGYFGKFFRSKTGFSPNAWRGKDG